MKKIVKRAIDYILSIFPYTKTLLKYRTEYVPPGHFYSPIPSTDNISFVSSNMGIRNNVDLNEKNQLELLNHFKYNYNEIPFQVKKTDGLRYYYDNTLYSYSDAIILHSFLRHFKPGKIIEVGSGYSSCVVLDTNELFLQNSMMCTFIEPFPERLHSLIKPEDFNNDKIEIIADKLENVDISIFGKLENNDILFIDSSHVAKAGSDVCHLFFEILPKLNSGVIIHFHDVFDGFEYPIDWLKEGRAWNEAYLLKAFLLYNDSFQVIFFSSFLENKHRKWYMDNMPLCLELHEVRKKPNGETYYLPNTGQSIWLKKVK